jgi:DNA polymerase-3 subunit epsilon
MAIEIVFSAGKVEILNGRKTARPGRGASILALLSDYVSVDVETTGLSPVYNEIIEVSALRVRGGQIVDRFSSLICPSDMSQVDEYITALTGISPAMLETAPSAEKVFPAFLDFVGSDVLVGHNVSFDVNFYI